MTWINLMAERTVQPCGRNPVQAIGMVSLRDKLAL